MEGACGIHDMACSMSVAKLAICSFRALARIFTQERQAVGGWTEYDHAPRTKREGIAADATAPTAGGSGTSVQTLQVAMVDSA